MASPLSISSKDIPNFLTASKAKNLRRLMFENNLKNGKKYHYFDIQFNPLDKKWYAWFHEIVEVDFETGEIKESK